jgi:hypothetical protein
VSPLDPPAAAARRQYVLDRIVEDLIGWGCSLDTAPARARQLLDHALTAGYALPGALQPPPAAGGGSTPEGRAAARAAFEAARRQGRQPSERAQERPAGAPGYRDNPRNGTGETTATGERSTTAMRPEDRQP